ncbi:MAG: carbohydrate ABC transporter permease [Streptococcaceae bacterium]|jgi:raffinose/stachyose/melibiose transport system permease protein|nr:carbohydrate ABC transporter permease [Streptococcaceae bacterium]
MKKSTLNRTNWPVTLILLLCGIVAILGPLYLAVMVALKTPNQMTHVLAFPTHIRWANFTDAIALTNFGQNFLNTLFITVVNLLFTLFTNAMAAYAISRNRAHSKLFNALYYYFISALFIPFNVLMLPLVKQASAFHLDNILGITFLYIVFGLPMNTFLYTGFISKIPVALDEAALMDGATPFQVFRYIIFPMLKPMHATVAILSFMWTWNDFLMPLILLSDPNQQTLQLSQYVFQGQFSTNYNLAFASYLMVILPVLIIYIIFQRFIIAGVVDGAVK